MLSTHSFNALLKTLEEPPAHVKFLLATTDPQKLPVTVLSRCLQFNLKRLTPDEIQGQLARVLDAEGVPYDPVALRLLARGADGSMRDGLSLLDQAIAYGGGRVGEEEIRAMLGVAGQDLSLGLAQALAAGDGPGVLAEVARIAELARDFEDVLADLLLVLHRVALVQQIPESLAADDPDREALSSLAATMAPEDVQLFYQILLTGQQDLPLAPEPRVGMEMVLLRALAFRPVDERAARRAAPLRVDAGEAAPRAAPEMPQPPAAVGEAATVIAETPSDGYGQVVLNGAEDWHRLIARLRLGGMANELAHHCELSAWDGRCLRLNLDIASQHVRVASAETRLRQALEQALGADLRLEICLSRPEGETPAQRRRRDAAERQAKAEQILEQDPVARSIREQLDAEWAPGSIKPSH